MRAEAKRCRQCSLRKHKTYNFACYKQDRPTTTAIRFHTSDSIKTYNANNSFSDSRIYSNTAERMRERNTDTRYVNMIRKANRF